MPTPERNSVVPRRRSPPKRASRRTVQDHSMTSARVRRFLLPAVEGGLDQTAEWAVSTDGPPHCESGEKSPLTLLVRMTQIHPASRFNALRHDARGSRCSSYPGCSGRSDGCPRHGPQPRSAGAGARALPVRLVPPPSAESGSRGGTRTCSSSLAGPPAPRPTPEGAACGSREPAGPGSPENSGGAREARLPDADRRMELLPVRGPETHPPSPHRANSRTRPEAASTPEESVACAPPCAKNRSVRPSGRRGRPPLRPLPVTAYRYTGRAGFAPAPRRRWDPTARIRTIKPGRSSRRTWPRSASPPSGPLRAPAPGRRLRPTPRPPRRHRRTAVGPAARAHRHPRRPRPGRAGLGRAGVPLHRMRRADPAPGVALAGLGTSLQQPVLFRVALSDVPAHRAGVGSGVMVTTL